MGRGGTIGPGAQSQLGEAIHQGQHLLVTLDQDRPRPLVAAIFGRELAQQAPLFVGNRVGPMPARLAARNHPSGVQFASGATAPRVAALAPQQIEGALDHGVGALEAAQGPLQSGVRSPESWRNLAGSALNCMYYNAHNT